MENKCQIFRGYETDNYTQKKYYILYIILEDNLSINLNFISEKRVSEEIFNINLYFNDGETKQVFIQKKTDPKSFTFMKKRSEKRLEKNNKDSNNYIIRVSDNEDIVNAIDNKNLLTSFIYLDL